MGQPCEGEAGVASTFSLATARSGSSPCEKRKKRQNKIGREREREREAGTQTDTQRKKLNRKALSEKIENKRHSPLQYTPTSRQHAHRRYHKAPQWHLPGAPWRHTMRARTWGFKRQGRRRNPVYRNRADNKKKCKRED